VLGWKRPGTPQIIWKTNPMSATYPTRQKIEDPMTDLGHGLYAFGAATSELSGLYVLTQTAPDAETALNIQEFWSHKLGWAIFTPIDLSQGDIEAFCVDARSGLPKVSDNTMPTMFVWLADPENKDTFPAAPNVGFLSQGGPDALAQSNALFKDVRIALQLKNTRGLGSLSLSLQDGAFGGPATIQLLATVADFDLLIDGEPFTKTTLPVKAISPSTSAFQCNIALEGPQAGSLGMPFGLDYGTLCKTFGFEPFFHYSPDEIHDSDASTLSEAQSTLRMPLYQPQLAQSEDAKKYSAVNVMLSPFHAGDARASGIFLDRAGRMLSGKPVETTVQYQQVQNTLDMVCSYGSLCNGAVLTLVPGDPLEQEKPQDSFVAGGFIYSAPTGGTIENAPMMPVGTYVPVQGTPAKGNPTPSSTTMEVMPGLFSRDFVQLAAGDLIGFKPEQPAFVGPSSANELRAGDPNTATTSLPYVIKGEASGGRGYYGQSNSANLYLASGSSDGVLTAANARLSTLETPSPFPMLWIAALLLEDGNKTPINPDMTTGFIEKLEQKAIGPARHAALFDQAATGPVVQLPTQLRTMNSLVTSEPSSTHPVVTPQGYVVDVNDAGLFANITLGIGDDNTALRFRGTGDPALVDPEVSTLLTRENLFLVATNANDKWNLQNELLVEGFNFKVDLKDATNAPANPSILIIKLDPRRSLRDMATDQTAWTNGGAFVDDAAAIIERLNKLFEIADPGKSEADDPFVAFRALANRKAWTGVIAFETPIDGNGMPADLQMLLGGIPGQLHAHHVGVDTNKVGSGAAKTEVAQSSIFGVINYRDQSVEPSNNDDPQYKVGELIAQISNSKLVELNVTVELILHKLLKRAVSLQNVDPSLAPNTLLIKGQYQKSGDIGRVVFASDTPFIYEAVRAGDESIRMVKSVHMTHANLVPISNDEDDETLKSGETRIQANFTLNGQIFFDPAPFPTVPNLDLYSYGLKDENTDEDIHGLMFSSLTVEIVFVLDADGAMVKDSKSVKLLESSLRPVATPLAVRPQSFLGTMPLKLTGFAIASDDADGDKVTVGQGGKSLNIVQLQAAPPDLDARKKLAEQVAKGEDVAPLPMPVSPYTTSAPIYGLQYAVSLGSLGALSGVHAGITATLTIAWGPAPSVPDNDAAAVFIELPSLSAGYQGFDLQGFVKTKFEDANLLQVETEPGQSVYAMSFDNVQLSVLGFGLPPGVLVDFFLFSGNQKDPATKVDDASSIGWLLSATMDKKSEDV
jgi:hypothetical protein